MNSVQLIGNMTRDAELRHAQNGTPVANFGIAVNDGREEPSFFDVVAFKRTAELVAEFVGKGSKVGIEGRLQQDRWEKDGQKRSKIVIIANRVEFLTPKRDADVDAPPRPLPNGDVPFPDDEVAF